MLPREAQGIGGSVGFEAPGRTENIAPQWAACKEALLELVEDKFARRILETLDFIANHVYFLVDFALREGAVKHDVGEQVGGAGELGFEHRGVIHRALLIGIGVEVAAVAFERIIHGCGAAPCRALERKVLHEVCHALVGRVFVARAGADHVAAIHYVGNRALANEAQSVGQYVCIVSHWLCF